MEWLARYIEFLTPDSIALASNYIKEHYADPRSKVTLEFMSYKHTSEAIPTVIQKLKTKDSEFNVGACDFKQYDEACSMLLMILEPLTVNDCNVEMMVKTDGLDVVCELIEEGDFDDILPPSCKKLSPLESLREFLTLNKVIVFEVPSDSEATSKLKSIFAEISVQYAIVNLAERADFNETLT